MYERLRTVRAVELALLRGRYVYWRAVIGDDGRWLGGTGRWIRIGNKGPVYIRGLLLFGEVRTRA